MVLSRWSKSIPAKLCEWSDEFALCAAVITTSAGCCSTVIGTSGAGKHGPTAASDEILGMRKVAGRDGRRECDDAAGHGNEEAASWWPVKK